MKPEQEGNRSVRRKLLATAVVVPIIVGAIFGAVPAYAETDPLAESPVLVDVVPESDLLEEPSSIPTPVPAEEIIDEPPGTPPEVPTVPPVDQVPELPAEEIVVVAPIIATPAVETPIAAIIQTPAVETPIAPIIQTPAVETPIAPTLQALATVTKVGPNERGYTPCWDDPSLQAVADSIDPFDGRTWPVLIRPGGTSDEWEATTRNDPRVPSMTSGPTGYDSTSVMCLPQDNRPTKLIASVVSTNGTMGSSTQSTFDNSNQPSMSDLLPPVVTGDAAFVYDNASAGPEIANLSIQPGQSITLDYVVAIDYPDRWIGPSFDLFGNPVSSSNQWTSLRTTGVKDVFFGDSSIEEWLTHSETCDDALFDRIDGQQVTVNCSMTMTVPETFTLPEYLKARGAWLIPQFSIGLETRYNWAADPGATIPDVTGDWSRANSMGVESHIRIDPSALWNPNAENKRFRVKAADTLTITPEGLLTGASWSQGEVESLATFITNVPEGGTMTPDGNLEFTSEQVGDYSFNYYLEDAVSGLRSASATGEIEVYIDPIIAPPVVVDPPLMVTPPTVVDVPETVVALPQAIPAQLASTGVRVDLGTVMGAVGIFLLGISLFAAATWRRGRLG